MDSEIVERRWRALIDGHDDSHTDLSHDGIRARNKRDFGHARMVEQDALDLHRVDVVATANEHLFHPSSQPEDALVVAGGEVACAGQPSTSVPPCPPGRSSSPTSLPVR